MSEKTDKLAQQLEDALVEEGRDRDTVNVILANLRPTERNLVGNLADLQRLGAIEAPKSGGNSDAFVDPGDSTMEYEPAAGTAAPAEEPKSSKASAYEEPKSSKANA